MHLIRFIIFTLVESNRHLWIYRKIPNRPNAIS